MICEWRSGQRSTPAGGVVIAKEARHSRLSTLSGHRADCGDLPVSKPASAHGAPSPSHGLSNWKIATSAPTTFRAPTPPIAALPRDDRPFTKEARRGRLSALSGQPRRCPRLAVHLPSRKMMSLKSASSSRTMRTSRQCGQDFSWLVKVASVSNRSG